MLGHVAPETFCFRFREAFPNFPRSHTERWQSG